MLTLREAKVIEGLYPQDFIEYIEKFHELYKLKIIESCKGYKLQKVIDKMPEPLKSRTYFTINFDPQLNRETDEVIWVRVAVAEDEVKE